MTTIVAQWVLVGLITAVTLAVLGVLGALLLDVLRERREGG